VVQVLVKDRNFEKVIRLFRNRCDRNGILSDVRKKEVFESKSQKRRRKNRDVLNRLRRRLKQLEGEV